MKRFVLNGRYGELLKFYGINTEEVLRKAQLPGDIFSHKISTMTQEEYFRFMDTVGGFVTEPEIPIKIACAENIEFFSPPIFAAYCSKNGEVCIERLARYKRLIGPMVMQVSGNNSVTYVEFTTEDGTGDLPQFLVETEFVFLIGILRKATKETIVPINVQMKKPVKTEAFKNFLGIPVEEGEHNVITFQKKDLELPFISYDEAMWDYFEPELSKRLAELEADDSISSRVKSALIELLPGGLSGIDAVSEKLGLSRRTLQRKLSEEGTTFQKQLNNTRKLLAIHYIRNTNMSTNEIAYLLGYQEVNSFLRAFITWTGKSISEYKKLI